jgi:hypothetical protein
VEARATTLIQGSAEALTQPGRLGDARSSTPRAGSSDLIARSSPQAVWLVRVRIAETLMGNRLHVPDAVYIKRAFSLTL